MSDKVDLDLVELRAKLRGWRVERNDAFVYVYDSDARVATFPRKSGGGWGVQSNPLTRPRLTLADIVAHPPEGWWHDGAAFRWGEQIGGSNNTMMAVVDAKTSNVAVARGLGVAYEAAAHRAIAALLVLPGEVEYRARPK